MTKKATARVGVPHAGLISARYGVTTKKMRNAVIASRNAVYSCNSCQRKKLRKGAFRGHWVCTLCRVAVIGGSFLP